MRNDGKLLSRLIALGAGALIVGLACTWWLATNLVPYLLASFIVLAIVLMTACLWMLRRSSGFFESELQNGSNPAEDLLRVEAAAGVGHWSAYSTTAVVSWSAEMFSIYGRDPETFIPTNAAVLSCVPPEDRMRFQRAVDQMISDGLEINLETQALRPDGSRRHVSIIGSAERDVAGELVRVFGVTQDITEKKEAELALRRSEERLELAIEAADAAIWDMDLAANKMSVSPRLAEFLRFDPDTWTLNLETHKKLCHPDDLNRLQGAFRAHVDEGAPFDLEYRMQRSDGEYIWIQSRGRAIRDDNGKASRIVGTITDITARKAQQESQRRNEETLQLAIQASGAGYFDRQWDQEEIHWSPKLFEILGMRESESRPHLFSFMELVHPEDREKLRADVNAFQDSGADLDMECRVKHANGHHIWVQLRAMVQRNDAGVPLRSVGFVIDITDQKLARLEVEQAKEKLELALEASGAGYYDYDWIEDSIEWSQRIYEILGLPHTFVPKMRTFNNLLHPDDAQLVDAESLALREYGTPFDIEARVKHASDRYIWVRIQAVQLTDEIGIPVRTIGFLTDTSERKRLELELESRKQMFEDVATAAGEYIWEFDRQGIFTFVSERVQAVLGMPAAQVVGHSPIEFMSPEYAKKSRIELVRLMKAQEGFKGFEVPGFRADGSVVWQQLSGTPILDADGKVSGYRGISQDITIQKEAEHAVVRSEKKFRDLIEGSIQGLVIHREYKPLFINDAYARMVGYENGSQMMEEVETLLDILPPEFKDNAAKFWRSSISGELDGQVSRGKVVNRFGDIIWTDAIGRVIDWDNEPAFQITVIDVTEGYNSELALKESEERFRVVAENASDLITIRGTSGELTYASPSAVPITGYQPEELINSPPGSMTHEDDLPALEQQRADRIAGRSNNETTLLWRMRRKDGRLIWLETSSSTLPPPEGETGYRVLSLSRDVTDRVERERELEAARDRLTRQADELSELAVRLEDERKRAEQANLAKSQFLAMMSHELRTPMTGVLGMVDLLNRTSVNKTQRDMLNTLQRSASALLELLNDVLDFSKIEAGEFDLEVVDFRLSTLLKDVQQLFEPVLSNKGLSLSVNISPGVQDVLRGDPTRLRQVLLNLIGNAQKFTENGGVTINIDQHESYSGDITLRVEVIDTGIGIAPDDQNRLFQAFVQAEANTTRKFGGTGLGLAICKQLVEAMGGVIWVDSELGRGSTFIFTLPTSIGDALEADRFQAEKAGDMLTLTPMRVLVVEDNPTTQMLVKSMLERDGHTVVTADNGAEAVEAAATSDFHIILMDMQMPVMDGPDATRKIRAMSGAIAECPVIALTADAIRSHRQTYLDAGANVVVTKPIAWTTLFSEMGRLTGQVNRGGSDADDATAEAVDDQSVYGDAIDYEEFDLLDTAMLDALAEALDEETLAPMLLTFKENMVKYVDELDDLVSQSKLDQSKRTAHALKGLSAQFGAARVSFIAKSIEDSALDVADVKRLLPILRQSVDETIAVFRRTH